MFQNKHFNSNYTRKREKGGWGRRRGNLIWLFSLFFGISCQRKNSWSWSNILILITPERERKVGRERRWGRNLIWLCCPVSGISCQDHRQKLAETSKYFASPNNNLILPCKSSLNSLISLFSKYSMWLFHRLPQEKSDVNRVKVYIRFVLRKGVE